MGVFCVKGAECGWLFCWCVVVWKRDYFMAGSIIVVADMLNEVAGIAPCADGKASRVSVDAEAAGLVGASAGTRDGQDRIGVGASILHGDVRLLQGGDFGGFGDGAHISVDVPCQP